jgi:AAA15 family ATPase/GTPase
MTEHFLTEIQIKAFKCFENFEANHLKRVNLISGKNNIGKTAFLEACYLHVSSVGGIQQFASAVFSVLHKRNLSISTNILNKIVPFHLSSNLKEINFDLSFAGIGLTDRIYQFKLMGKQQKESLPQIVKEELFLNLATSAPFIYNNPIKFIKMGFYDKQNLLEAFYKLQEKDKEDELNRFIHEFDNSIEVFKVIGDKLRCKVNGSYQDIEDFGDGLLSYLGIICYLYAAENSYLFLDEIENGIHYSHHDRLWHIIFTLSKQVNCQVFITTHSKEIVESFNRVALEMQEQEINYISLVRDKNKQLKAFTLNNEMLAFSIKQEHEIRL